MRGFALELGPFGITANAVAPGWIATSPTADSEVDHGRATPLRRPGRPHEVAEMVAFLARGRAKLHQRAINRDRRRQHDPRDKDAG